MSDRASRSSREKVGGSVVDDGLVPWDEDEREADDIGAGAESVERKAPARRFVRIRTGISSTMEEKVKLCSTRLPKQAV